MLEAEAAAAFDELTRSGRDALLSRAAGRIDWPNGSFGRRRLYSGGGLHPGDARARTLAVEKMGRLFFAGVRRDCVAKRLRNAAGTATNLTGQPAVIVPNGVRGADAPAGVDKGDGDAENEGGPGTPVSLTFLGGLYRDAEVLAVARGYQRATGFELVHPRM